MEKPVVFISHISEEREIASALKKVIEKSFMGLMDVFVSSDPRSVSLGRKWLEKVSEALNRCAIEIVLASPVSVRRPWITFEAGAGWIRDIPVIPLCHSGMNPDILPAPLNTLQSTVIEAEALRVLLPPVLSEALGCDIPTVDFSEFIAVVTEYEQTSAKRVEISEERFVPDSDGLAEHESITLQVCAEEVNAPDDYVQVWNVKNSVEGRGYRKLAASLALKILERKQLVELHQDADFNDNYFWTVRVTDEGWLWLEMNKGDIQLRGDGLTQDNVRPSDEVPF